MPARQLKALIVDADAIVCRTLAFALGKEEFACAQAANGDEALAKLHAERFDLVVTDLKMPGKHGHALAVEILADKNRPVIVVHSSLDEPRLVKDLLARGVDDFIPKPTNYGAFAAKIKTLVERRRLAAEGIEKTAESNSGPASIEPGGPRPPTTLQAASLSESEMQEVIQGGCLRPAASGTIERRSVGRRPYPKIELLAPCGPKGLPNPSMFHEVLCHEISTTGISFFLPRPPGFEAAVITLGKSLDKISMLIRVVHCTEQDDTGRQRFVVGGEFERRIFNRELRGGHPAVQTV